MARVVAEGTVVAMRPMRESERCSHTVCQLCGDVYHPAVWAVTTEVPQMQLGSFFAKKDASTTAPNSHRKTTFRCFDCSPRVTSIEARKMTTDQDWQQARCVGTRHKYAHLISRIEHEDVKMRLPFYPHMTTLYNKIAFEGESVGPIDLSKLWNFVKAAEARARSAPAAPAPPSSSAEAQ